MMKWIKSHWRGILRGNAILLILISVFIGYFWFYQMGPFRRVLDPTWVQRHSPDAHWHQIEMNLKRFRWTHDDGHYAGVHGDRDFMAWAMRDTNPDDDISSCQVGHKDLAFSMITNHDLGSDAESWLEWWKGNDSASQLEWLRNGFVHFGVSVSIPPEGEDVLPLIRLMAGVSPSDADRVPAFLKYNAFRWLRDSDFNPVAFAINDMPDYSEEEIGAGLLEYLRYERLYPKANRAGRLQLGGDEDLYSDHPPLPKILQPWFAVSVYVLLVGLPFIAVGLVVLANRPTERRVEQQ